MAIFKPCFPNGIKEFPFSPEDVRDIWRMAQDDFMRTGDIGKTVRNLSDTLGLDPYHIAQAIGRPKTIPRAVANDAWIKASNRMRILSGSKAIVTQAQRAPILNALDKIYNVPRSLATLYHWGVFTMTHGGDFLFTPSEYGRFFPQYIRGWRAVSPQYFADAIQQHLMKVPMHGEFAAAGLDNNPYSHAIGIFEKGPSSQWAKPGARGYGTLAMARDDLMNNLWNRVKRIDPTAGKDQMRSLAKVVNHVWGSVKLPPGVGPIASRLIFATRLWPARLMSTFVDIPKAATTFLNWPNATAAQRVAALFQARRVAQVLVIHHSLVAANAAFNRHFGGANVNMSDPSRAADWMAFKIGPLTIRPPSAILEAERVLGGMAYATFVGGKKSAGDVLKDYAAGKLNPAIHLANEAISGITWAGERTPFKGLRERISGTPPTDQYGHPIKTAEPAGQYVMERTLPIPVGGAAREIYNIFKQEGLSSAEAKAWMHSIADPRVLGVGALEAQGVIAHENYNYKTGPPNKLGRFLGETVGPVPPGRKRKFRQNP